MLEKEVKMNIYKQLKEWRESRKLSGYNHKQQVQMDIEETFELMGYNKVKTAELVTDFMSRYYVDNKVSEHEIIDAHADKIIFAINAIALMGYDVDKVMNETINEIMSRKQCPIQKAAWEEGLCLDEKWMKDTEQKNTYKAKYLK